MQDAKSKDTAALIKAVNKTGKAFLITTDLAGRTVARIACRGFLTQLRCSPFSSLHPMKGASYRALLLACFVCQVGAAHVKPCFYLSIHC
jgi:hypothetical protein